MSNLQELKIELHKILDENGFGGVSIVLGMIENSNFGFNRSMFSDLRNQAIQQFTQLAPTNFISALKIFIDNLGFEADNALFEVDSEKTSIYHKIIELQNFVQKIKIDNSQESEINNSAENDFKDIDFNELILAIQNDNCILFIGPEISVDANKESLHENFYKSFNNGKIVYNTIDGFFMPGYEPLWKNNIIRYYKDEFHKKNKIGKDIIEKLIQLPFSLIISYCPDDTAMRLFSKYNIGHQAISYSGIDLKFDSCPSSDNPVLYNALGCASINGRYIFTHEQLNNYLKIESQKKIPVSIGAKIRQATDYIFLGFDYNKWHFRLLMFELEFMKDAKPYAFETKQIIDDHKIFLNKQFGFNFVNAHYDEFTRYMIYKGKKIGICRSLKTLFVESILNDLEKVKIRAIDSSRYEEFTAIKSELREIENKIRKNQG